jgi:hypothetical protein
MRRARAENRMVDQELEPKGVRNAASFCSTLFIEFLQSRCEGLLCYPHFFTKIIKLFLYPQQLIADTSNCR